MDREKIESARMHALGGRYSEALAVIGSLESEQKLSKPALCLKGTVLALKANDVELRLSTSEIERLRNSAQDCFESILKEDKDYVLAYIDLGDLWSNRGNHIAAIEFFEKALTLLRAGRFVECHEGELEEAHQGRILALRQTNVLQEIGQALSDAKRDLPTVEWL